jgi:hypothetical protein
MPRDPSSGPTGQVAAWRLNLFKTAVYGFLALYTELSRRHRDKPIWGAVVITPRAYPEAAFLGTAEAARTLSQVAKVSVEITDCDLRNPAHSVSTLPDHRVLAIT